MKQIIFFLLFITLTKSEITTFDCGVDENTVTCSYDSSSKTLTFSGKGQMSPYQPWYSYNDQMVKLVISGDIPIVVESAFSNFDQLELVEIGENVTVIGSYAFSFCQKLSSVRTLGKTQLTSIGLGAFQNCERLALFSSIPFLATCRFFQFVQGFLLFAYFQ